ncbi:MAG: hypothetical protein EGQ26_06985, partial [Clostridiales bacterium]|nr:hypothetical protein [Clostridiales bacterium]
NEGILYVFLVFQTEEVGQKDGGDSQTQLCGAALIEVQYKADSMMGNSAHMVLRGERIWMRYRRMFCVFCCRRFWTEA